jgi:hypothetical protein
MNDVFIMIICSLCLNCLQKVSVDLEYVACLLNVAVLCCDSHHIVLLTAVAGPVHRCHGTFIPADVY